MAIFSDASYSEVKSRTSTVSFPASLPVAISTVFACNFGIRSRDVESPRPAEINDGDQSLEQAHGYRLGILVNFASYPNLEWERIVR